jgi:flagellar basal body-associated protein FliL
MFTMKRNKIIALITLIAILITSVAILASCGGKATSADIPAETFGEITWEYKDKTLFITGTGSTPAKMGTFANGKDTPWYKKSATIRNSVEKVVLTNVSEVSDYAFFSFTKLSSIDFGTNTTVIGKCAFAFCNLLTEVTIPEGVTTIGESAFEGCAALSKVNLPSTVTSLGERAFAYTQNFKNLNVDDATFDTLFDSYVNAFEEGRAYSTLPTVNAGNASDTPETDAPAETDAPTETDAPEATDAPAETEPAEPKNMTTTIIAIVVLAVVIVGIVVGAILLMRSNKNQKKDALTVRKNKDEKDSKKDNKKDNKKKSSKKKK